MPEYVRFFSIAALVVAVLVVVVGFYRERSRSPFRLKSEHARLSTDVTAEVNNYERLESDGGVSKYYIKASFAKTFSDNHQELENVYLEVYDKDGVTKDHMVSDRALYVPEEDKNFTAYLNGNVQIDARDGLRVKTDNITYTKNTETADADEMVEFDRGAVRGRSVGAIAKLGEKRLELLKNVEIEAFESPELMQSNIRYAKINAGSASFDQIANIIGLNDNLAINLVSAATGANKGRTTDIQATRGSAFFEGADAGSARVQRLEMVDNVRITSLETGQTPTTIDAGYALYDKPADRFDLKQGSHIVTTTGEKTTDIRSAEAAFEQTAHKLALTGGAEVQQGSDALKGDAIYADLYADNTVKNAIVRGNASARQAAAERTISVSAPELNAAFNESKQLRDANAVGQSHVQIVPVASREYSVLSATAGRGIGLVFQGEGLLTKLLTDGRTTIDLTAPDSGANAANKRLTADNVVTLFHQNGKDIKRAEAVGSAELYVEPRSADPQAYKTTINAPRFDCDFFPAGNNARQCVAGKGTKTVRVPFAATAQRGTQTLAAARLTADFAAGSSDIERLAGSGNVKFTELDRNAIAAEMIFTQADEVVRFRGGEPTVWDSRGRAKANEIDWDTRNDRSSLRGAVATTYYSRKTMNDSMPFDSAEKPVFLTAAWADMDHVAQTATYMGNARGWQDNNYVRGDKIVIDQLNGKLLAEGNVQSALYNAKVRQAGKEATVPVYAASSRLTYDRDQRLLQYSSGVDIRQGSDRLTAGSADIYLNEANEVSRTLAQTNVVITQPSRRATGDWAQYSAQDEVAVIRGNPATVNDTENGSSQSSEIMFHMRENRVASSAKPKQGPSGRTRSVYKVDPSK